MSRTITLTDSQKSLVNTLPQQYINLNLGDTCNVVLAYILSKAQDNIAMLTNGEIMENTGFGSNKTVTRAISKMITEGVFVRAMGKKGCPSIYRFDSTSNDSTSNVSTSNNSTSNNSTSNNSTSNNSTSNNSDTNFDSTSNDDNEYDDYDMYHDAPLNNAPQSDDDEYDDYDLYHPTETASHNSEIADDDDPEPTPVEPNYNVNPWDDEPYNKYLDAKEAWERRQKEKAQPKYNFSLWGKLLAIRDFDTNRIEGFYFYTYEGLERAEDFGKKYNSPILRKLPTHALMDQVVKGNGEFGVLSCYDMNFTFSECNEKPSWVTNRV